MKKYGKYTLIGWSWRILMWIALTPIFILLLLSILIYIPPVQKYAVDKTAEMLSEEMQMEVSVERVALRFPLDLSIGGMLAVQEGDTVVDARALDVSVRALPLFDMRVEVDGIRLSEARINTRNLIDAVAIRGTVRELSLDSHSTDLKNELAVVNKAVLRDADLTVLLADSVPEDTTPSAKVNWKIDVRNLQLQRVKAAVYLAPRADSLYAKADIGDAFACAFLDLGKEVYQVEKLRVRDSKASFEQLKQPRLQGQLDPAHLLFEDMSLKVDSFVYKGTGEMSLDIVHLSAREKSGLDIRDAHGRVEMDSVSLSVPKLKLATADSQLGLSCRMDLNAFADTVPGQFSLLAEGQVGKGDIIYFTRMGGEATRDVCTVMSQTLPQRPAFVQLKAGGNLQALNVSKLHLDVPGLFVADGKAQLYDLLADMGMKAALRARDAHGAKLEADAVLALGTQTYSADISFDSVVVNNYIPMAERAAFSGQATAKGRGFDFFSPHACVEASADLYKSHFGKIDLSNVSAAVTLNGHRLACDVACDNKQLSTSFLLNAELQKHLVSGTLDISLPHIDAQSMGFSDERLEAATSGNVNFSYNWHNLFRVDSHIDALSLFIGSDSLHTDVFDLYAEAKKDSTAATFSTGDCQIAFATPMNMFHLMPRIERLQSETVKQFKKREVNLDHLKRFLPHLSLHADVGSKNPVADILKIYGITFDDFSVNVETSPLAGIVSDGHVYSLAKDETMLDTAFFRITQDSTQLDYNVGLRCHQQPTVPAFKANLEGFLMADQAEARLTYFDKRGRKGIDLGVMAHASDTCITYKLFPEKPVIAFKEFELNEDNYVVMYPKRPIRADVRLASPADSCSISLYADENEFKRQVANVVVNNLNLKQLLTVVPVPGLPSMSGLLNVDANYIDQEENFMVEGTAGVMNFNYDNTRVGDVGTQFTYNPVGDAVHDVEAQLALNGVDVLSLDGQYDASGAGSLDADVDFLDLPMGMLSPFIPDHVVGFKGTMAGCVKATGALDNLALNGGLMPHDVHVLSDMYSLDLTLANDTISFDNSRVTFDNFNFYGANSTPLTLNGYVDFSDMEKLFMSLSLRGTNFKLIEAKRSPRKVLFGDMYGDFFARVIGSVNDLTVRGLVRVLPTTDITYIMSETPLYQGDRLEDIVTFVDFNAPPPSVDEIEKKTFLGIDMLVALNIDDGAKLNGEFSADKQSYVNVQGGGSVTMQYTPEGVLSLQGRYTINEGVMKYTLPVIPLKTFNIRNGSYVEFTGDPTNPLINVAATERVRATVGESSGASRSVAFDVGLKITNSLNDMGLAFTIEAPEDMAVQNELAGCSDEEKNKLAVAMLATGMYLSSTNSKGFTAGNALNSFLQNEINNIAGRALSTMVDINVGMEQTTRDDGSRRTDYSFKFSRHFFSDRLNVVIGGKVSTDGDDTRNESGAYIDDVSLEWRLDNGNTQYVKLFHGKDYSNLIEGELDKNGAGILLRKKVDKLSDLFIWRSKKDDDEEGGASKKKD